MKISRRQLFKFTTLAAFGAGATIFSSSDSANLHWSSSKKSVDLKHVNFKKLLESSFSVTKDDLSQGQLILVKAEKYIPKTKYRSTQKLRQFKLVFRGDKAQTLKQDVYTFENSQLGRFDLLITPMFTRSHSNDYYHASLSFLK